MSKYPLCTNCRIPLRHGFLCLECGRMVVATIAGEFVVAAILFMVRAVWH